MPRSRLFARLVVACALLAPAFAWAAPNIIYVTRHAEKGADGKDPELTAQGLARAATVARLLGKAGIGAVFSTPTKRTQQTAQPLATPVLVVGHSNTVPELVRLLGGAVVAPVGDNEYDRLYQLIVAADGTVTTVLLTSVAAPL